MPHFVKSVQKWVPLSVYSWEVLSPRKTQGCWPVLDASVLIVIKHSECIISQCHRTDWLSAIHDLWPKQPKAMKNSNYQCKVKGSMWQMVQVVRARNHLRRHSLIGYIYHVCIMFKILFRLLKTFNELCQSKEGSTNTFNCKLWRYTG